MSALPAALLGMCRLGCFRRVPLQFSPIRPYINDSSFHIDILFAHLSELL